MNDKDKQKLINVYGVMLTLHQEMRFAKWLENSQIAMNTKTEKEMKRVVLSWLNLSIKD